MADETRNPDVGTEGADRGSTTGTPRWVKVFGVIALAVIALFVVVLLVRGGEHGPGRHSPGGGSDGPGAHTGPPPGVTHTEP
jgi:hypothetical protein